MPRYSDSATVVVHESSPPIENNDSESKTCGKILVVLSWILVILTMPFSLFVCFKMCKLESKTCVDSTFQERNFRPQ